MLRRDAASFAERAERWRAEAEAMPDDHPEKAELLDLAERSMEHASVLEARAMGESQERPDEDEAGAGAQLKPCG
jgi:hypothetical protein